MGGIEKTNEGAQAVKYSIRDEEIGKLREQAAALVISGVDDRAGYEAVHDTRQIVKRARLGVEETRKELKAESLEYCRKVEAEAKRLTALLEPIESELQDKQDAIDSAKAQAKAELQRKRDQELTDRVAALVAIGGTVDMARLREIGAHGFAELLADEQLAHDKRKAEAEAQEAEWNAKATAAVAEAQAKEAGRQKQEEAIKLELEAANKRLAEERQAATAEAEKIKAEAAAAVAEARAEVEKARAEAQAVIDGATAEAARKAETERKAKAETEAQAEAERKAAAALKAAQDAEAKTAAAIAALEARRLEIRPDIQKARGILLTLGQIVEDTLLIDTAISDMKLRAAIHRAIDAAREAIEMEIAPWE